LILLDVCFFLHQKEHRLPFSITSHLHMSFPVMAAFLRLICRVP
jgi:hypothetical protein